MSALKRLLSGHHKLHKHNSLPPTSDIRIDYLDLEHVHRHGRCKSKPTTPISPSTPIYKTDFPISGSPVSQSPPSSASSSKSNIRHGRSRSRARAKHERAKSLDVKATQYRQESLERAERRRDSYIKASLLLLSAVLSSYHCRFHQDPLKDNYGELPLNMSQEGIGQSTCYTQPISHGWMTSLVQTALQTRLSRCLTDVKAPRSDPGLESITSDRSDHISCSLS